MPKLHNKNELKDLSDEVRSLSEEILQDEFAYIIGLGRLLWHLMLRSEEGSELGFLKSEILFTLVTNNGCLTSTVLGKKINRTKSTISRAIRKLENDGFLETEQRPMQNDRRYKRVFTTQKGIEYVKERIPLRRSFAEEMGSCISAEELSALCSLSRKYYNNLLSQYKDGI